MSECIQGGNNCTCNAGFFRGQPEASTHQSSPANSTASVNASNYSETAAASFAAYECYPCPWGSMSQIGSVNQSECRCQAGYSGPDGGPCSSCPAGTYKAAPGTGTCASCPSQANSESGWDSCICNAGYSGQNGTSFPCTACEAGKFKPNIGMGQCSACNQGYFQDEVASTTCFPCLAASFADSTGNVLIVQKLFSEPQTLTTLPNLKSAMVRM